MKQYAKLSGLTCDACVAKVSQLLNLHPKIHQVSINEERNKATLETENQIPTHQLKDLLQDFPKYQIEQWIEQVSTPKSILPIFLWIKTYKPILLIFGFIALVSYLSATDWMTGMRYFMAGFFLCFSFFKFLDLAGFAESYSEYDILAKHWKPWAYVYPFVEFGLGIAFLVNIFPIQTNLITVFVMLFSSIGVIQSVIDKKTIRCACLGNIFNLPMSTVTIVEDLLMVVMSGWMLYVLL